MRACTFTLMLALAFNSISTAADPEKWKIDHPVITFAISPDGKYLAAGGLEKEVDPHDLDSFFAKGRLTIIDLATGKARDSWVQDRSVVQLAISPDSKNIILAHATRGGVIRANKVGSVYPTLLSFPEGKIREIEFDGHRDLITGFAFTPDGKRIVTSSGDGTGRIWDAANGKELIVMKTGNFNNGMAISPDGKLAAIGSGAIKLRVFSMEAGNEVLAIEHGHSASHVAFSSDGKWLASCSDGVDDLRVWDLKTGKAVASIQVGFDEKNKKEIASNVTSNLIFSPDSKFLITGNGDLLGKEPGELCIWSIADRKLVGKFKGQPVGITRIALSPDGKKLYSSSKDGTILAWDLASLTK